MKLPLLALCLITTTTAFFVREECLVKDGEETNLEWKGSHMDLSLWIPEEEDLDVPIFSLTLEYSENIQYDFDIVKVWHSFANIKRHRKGRANEEHFNITAQLRSGWAEFNLTAEEQLELWNKPSTKILSVGKNMKILRVTIKGSNVTINCPDLSIGWQVDGNVLIPLQRDEQIYHFSFLSNYQIKPKVIIQQHSLGLGWDELGLTDVTKLAEDFWKSLPRSVQHNFTLICSKAVGTIICRFKTIEQTKEIKSLTDLGSLPKSLGVSTDYPAIVYFHRTPPPAAVLLPPSSNVTVDTSPSLGSGGYVFGITILSIICTGLVAGNLLFLRFYKRQQNSDYDIRTTLESAINKKISGSRSTVRSMSLEPVQEPSMWNAVVENDLRYIEFLLQRGSDPQNPEKGHSTTPYEEAHIRGKKDVLQVIRVYKKEKPTIPEKTLIAKVMKELKKRIYSVFEAAAYGIYEQERGVGPQLANYSLPGTIRDQKGRSLLHYMASNSFMDGRPAWEYADMEHFIQNHECYVNAVDHQGNTALHVLAMRKRGVEKRVFWNGKEENLSKTWLAVAEFLMSQGCDPRISNNKGELPHQLATSGGNHDLADLFRKNCEVLGAMSFRESVKGFDKLVEAAQNGDTKQIKALLQNHVPLLPICSSFDPLVVAVDSCQWHAVFLLLSAGAPICSRSVMGLTALEAAHNTLGIPACFPALLRKAYVDMLESEISRLPKEEANSIDLLCGMQDFINQVKVNGSDSKWTFLQETPAEKSRYARILVSKASELGLSLTCQLFAMENVYLHSLPDEQNPIENAISNNHVDTQIVLYRDLKNTPFTLNSAVLGMVSQKLLEDIYVSNFVVLEEALSKQGDPMLSEEGKSEVRQYSEKLKKYSISSEQPSEDDNLQEPPRLLLYLLGKYGLDGILHILLQNCKSLNINAIVEHYSNSTLLHVASMYGQITMVELLLHMGVELDMVTIGGFTAAHLPALWGQMECMNYILEHMKNISKDTNCRCQLGMTASQLLEMREDFCHKYSYPFITHDTSMFIKNNRYTNAKAFDILEKKSKLLEISDGKSLLERASALNSKSKESKPIQKTAHSIATHICKQIDDPRIKGEIKSVGHMYEGNDLFQITDARFIYELEDSRGSRTAADFTCENSVNNTRESNSSVQSEVKKDSTLLHTFLASVKKIVSKNELLSPGISVAPPFIRASFQEVYVYTMWWKDGNFQLIRIGITPCVRSEIPPDSKIKSLPEKFYKELKTIDYVHLIAGNSKEKWLYRGYNYENIIFTSLNEYQKKVWMSCRLLNLLLSDLYWLPVNSARRYMKLQFMKFLEVHRLTDFETKTLFLEELATSKNWKESDLFDRVYSVFERAATKDKDGKWIPRERVCSFITPGHHSFKVPECIGGVMDFLDFLKNPSPYVDSQDEQTKPCMVSFDVAIV